MNTRLRTPGLLLSILLAGPVLLTGCGDGDGSAEASSTSESSPTAAGSGSAGSAAPEAPGDTADDGSTEAPSFPANAEPDTAEASTGSSVTVSDIRIGRHDGYDRVVLEVGGRGTPGWDVRYVAAATSQGSGETVDVAGDAVLQVTLTGVGYPYDTGVAEFSSSGPVSSDGTEVVTEVVFDATFEGTSVAFVGTKAQAPFRVYLLENPTRVVVDAADPS